MKLGDFEAEVVRLVPALRGASFVPLGEGMDNRAILVGGEFVFRFPKHLEAAERLARELALLPKLGLRLHLAVPQFEYVGQLAANGQLFAGYRLIPGVSLPADLALPSMHRAARAGHCLGADVLIELLSTRNERLLEAASWALEMISGLALGSDEERWRESWNHPEPGMVSVRE